MPQLPLTFPCDRSAIRIWEPIDVVEEIPEATPAASPPRAAVAHTIESVWRGFRLPEMQRNSPSTLSEYQTHINRWHEFWDTRSGAVRVADAGVECRIAYPTLTQITRSALLEWRTWLSETLTPITNRTLNKHVGSIQAIGETAVKHELIGAFPKLDPLPITKAARKLHLSHKEAVELKKACRVATWPNKMPFPAPLYWEALLVGFCCYGFRTQEQVRNLKRMETLEWEGIRDDVETPHPDGKAVNDLGWIIYVPQKQKNKKPEPLVLPMISAYRKHLDAIRPPDAKGPVFPFPLCNRSFYKQWKEILEAAGVKPKPGLDGDRPEYEIKHMRKTATKWINDHGSSLGMPGIGDSITGHADDRSPDREVQSRVTQQHYDFNEDRVLKVLSSLPLPPEFQAPLFDAPRQKMLF
ncbi:hypothetical protein SH661x_000388 [Planctomicrobium sp. SH661]|uniref:hypothetical protein n=1 Tax=Planctomicrobium sp. SH661 TaxID=3448124 RepID=UPI003F5BBDDA